MTQDPPTRGAECIETYLTLKGPPTTLISPKVHMVARRFQIAAVSLKGVQQFFIELDGSLPRAFFSYLGMTEDIVFLLSNADESHRNPQLNLQGRGGNDPRTCCGT